MKKQKRMFRHLAICLILALFLVIFGTSGGRQDTGSSSGPITLHYVAAMEPFHRDFSEVMVFVEYEKKSGIHINWECIPSSNFTEKRNLLLAGGDLPDAFYRGSFNNSDLLKYGMEGVFITLNDLMSREAPHFTALLNEMPDVRKGITQSDGKIYGFPALCSLESANFPGKLWYYQPWLDKLNVKFPTTLDEFYNLCKVVRDTDLNGNGIKDEIPLSANGINAIFDVFLGIYGLQNRGSAHRVDIDPRTNALRFIPTSAQYRQVLETFHKFYSEGLLDNDIFTINQTMLVVKADEEKVFVFPFPNPSILPPDKERAYIAGEVLAGPNGDRLTTPISPVFRTGGAFTITNKNKYPVETVRWVDYFYSDEGTKNMYLGIEGVTYAWDEKLGDYNYLDFLLNDPNGLSMTDACAPYLIGWGGMAPHIQTSKFFPHTAAKHPASIIGTNKAMPYFPKEIWSPFTYTASENDTMLYISNDIDRYINEMRATFITRGVTDAQWNEYVRTFDNLDLRTYMNIYQAAYQRYSR